MANRRNQSIVEDCLKVVYTVGEWDPRARTITDIADRLKIATSTASTLVKRLSEEGFLRHERYGDVGLTDAGLDIALRMVRRHRLIETFLVETLGYTWDQVHDEAEVLEHTMSDLMLTRVDEVLDRPWRDPHGDAIPTPDGVVHLPRARPLASLAPGQSGYVARLLDESPEMLRWFAEQGVALDVEIRVAEHRPFGGATVVELASRVIDVGPQAVGAIWLAAEPPFVRGSDSGCHYSQCEHPRPQSS